MLTLTLLLAPAPLLAQEATPDTVAAPIIESGDSITIRFVEADLRAVIQALARYLPKPVLAANVPAVRVSLETPEPVSRRTVKALLQGLVESHNLELTEDAAYFRIAPKPAERRLPTSDLRPPTSDPIQLFVIRLKHARAADVAATVNQLFGAGGSFSGQAGLANGTLSDELRRNNLSPAGPPEPGANGAAARGGASLAGPVVIVPDALTNSLLIRASRSDYEVIQRAVAQLDIRPLQVLIEVLIVEARRDNTFSLGADLFLPETDIGGDETIEGELLGGGLGDLVIQLMNLGRADIDAVLRTAQAKGYVEIVSRPVLLASNNTEARFLVGTQRPFVQVSRSLPTDTPQRDQVVQYKDVGTELTVLPTINQDGYVSLVIQQEINQATTETQFDAPIISTREAVTQVLVKDGQTIVLGGLRDRQKDRTSSGIPILSGIPIIGGLFGGTTRRNTATELYLFLTPRIIRTDEDAERVTRPLLPDDEREATETGRDDREEVDPVPPEPTS